MGMGFFGLIEHEISRVEMMLEKEFILRAGVVTDMTHVKLTPLDGFLRPASVILTAKLFGFFSEQIISLAAIVQFIYLASRIHGNVKEGLPNEKLRNDPLHSHSVQFAILGGDYLYGKFYTTLCKSGLFLFLRPLAEAICTIHEGGVLKKQNANSAVPGSKLQLEIIKKETANLFVVGNGLAAELSGASLKEKISISNFSLDFGMAYGLLERGVNGEAANEYLAKASEELFLLPDNNYRAVFQELIDVLSQRKLEIPQQMVG